MKGQYKKTEDVILFDKTIKILQSLILNEGYLEKISPNLSQFKLFFYGLSLIENEQTGFASVKLNSGMISKVLGKKISGGQISSNIFSQLQNTEKVGTFEFDLSPFPMGVYKIFFEDFSCTKNPLTCEFTLADFLKPYLLGLEENPCCLVKMCYISNFKSVSALKLFVYFNAIVKMNNYVTCTERLMAIMNYTGEKRNFINRVLKPAIDFINQNTNLTVAVTPIKRNQPVLGFVIKSELKAKWIVNSCGLESGEDKGAFEDISKYIPQNCINKPIQFDELTIYQKNILLGLRKKYV